MRDLILEGAIDVLEAIEMNRADRIPAILDREPEARDRPFGRYLATNRAVPSFMPGVSRSGWYTPLAFAIEGGRLDAARLLIDRGADPAARAPDGRTLADLAAARGHAAILELLKLRRR